MRDDVVYGSSSETPRTPSGSQLGKRDLSHLLHAPYKLNQQRSALLKRISEFVLERQQYYKHDFTHVVDLSNFADGTNNMPQRDQAEHWLYVIKDTSWNYLKKPVTTKMKGVVLILSPPLLKQEPKDSASPPLAYVTRFENGRLKQHAFSDWQFAHTFIPKTDTEQSKAKVFAQRQQEGIDDENPEHHNNATDDMLCAYIAEYLHRELVTRDSHLKENIQLYAHDHGPLFDLLVNTHIHALTCKAGQFHFIKTFVPKSPKSMTALPEPEKEAITVDPINLIVEIDQ